MYVRKWLALTLAGAVLAMGFSGCDRTIIEHQFHTNTVTETIIEKVPVETEDVAGVQSIIDLFEENGIPFAQILGLQQIKVQGRDLTTNDVLELHNRCGQEDIKNFFDQPGGSNIIAVAERFDSRGLEDITYSMMQVDTVQRMSTRMYDALITYIEENNLDWTACKEKFDDDLKFYGYIAYNENDPTDAVIYLVLNTD